MSSAGREGILFLAAALGASVKACAYEAPWLAGKEHWLQLRSRGPGAATLGCRICAAAGAGSVRGTSGLYAGTYKVKVSKRGQPYFYARTLQEHSSSEAHKAALRALSEGPPRELPPSILEIREEAEGGPEAGAPAPAAAAGGPMEPPAGAPIRAAAEALTRRRPARDLKFYNHFAAVFGGRKKTPTPTNRDLVSSGCAALRSTLGTY